VASEVKNNDLQEEIEHNEQSLSKLEKEFADL
jgi:hypothetical protein